MGATSSSLYKEMKSRGVQNRDLETSLGVSSIGAAECRIFNILKSENCLPDIPRGRENPPVKKCEKCFFTSCKQLYFNY